MHKKISLTYDHLKCYQVDYCPFGGYENNNLVSKYIDKYANLIDNFFIVGEKPDYSHSLSLKKELVCLQMVPDHKIDMEIREKIVNLNDAHGKELSDLVNLVQPGYFNAKQFYLVTIMVFLRMGCWYQLQAKE